MKKIFERLHEIGALDNENAEELCSLFFITYEKGFNRGLDEGIKIERERHETKGRQIRCVEADPENP